jgi:hypothetical protein
MPNADNFDKLRDSIWGLPGFMSRTSTIIAPPWLFVPSSTWIVESVKTDEGQAIMLQSISADGSNRIYLPKAVCEAIYRQHDSLIKQSCSRRAKNAAQTRKNRAAGTETAPGEKDGNI